MTSYWKKKEERQVELRNCCVNHCIQIANSIINNTVQKLTSWLAGRILLSIATTLKFTLRRIERLPLFLSLYFKTKSLQLIKHGSDWLPCTASLDRSQIMDWHVWDICIEFIEIELILLIYILINDTFNLLFNYVFNTFWHPRPSIFFPHDFFVLWIPKPCLNIFILLWSFKN